jgi:hypothetical protein
MLLVNGPVRHELAINSGIGAMGPYSHANAVIGRAYALACQNLQGGSIVGDTYMGSQGNAYGYSFCFGENEERSPWEAFHVEHGYPADTSVVTALLGGWYTLFGTGVRETWRETFTRAIQGCDTASPPLLILDPLVAEGLVRKGLTSRTAVKEWVAEASRMPAREYWDNIAAQSRDRPRAIAGVEPYASRLRAADDELVRCFEPDEIKLAVVGGETAPTWRMISFFYWKQASVDDWR